MFAVLNACFVPFIWYFYVETKRLSLEEIDRMFEIYHDSGKKISFEEAAGRAKEESEEIKRQVWNNEHGKSLDVEDQHIELAKV